MSTRPPATDWATDWDHLDPRWVQDPYPIWDELRHSCPVAHTDRFGGVYLPTRYHDIRAIAIELLAQKGLGPERLSAAALAQLERLPLPGNVRELENLLARARILAGSAPIEPSHLMPATPVKSRPVFDELLGPEFSLDKFERDLIQHAILKAGGNKTAAARLLGITRRRLYSRLVSLDDDAAGEDDG